MIVIQKFSQQQRQLRNVCSKEQQGSPKRRLVGDVGRVQGAPSPLECDSPIEKCDNSTHPERRRARAEAGTGRSRPEAVISIRSINMCCFISLLLVVAAQAEPPQPPLARPPPEYQLVGQVNQEAHLPCLIGRQLYCGEPYFIAWYKLNGSSKSWVRIEHSKSEPDGDLAAGSGGGDNENNIRRHQHHNQHHLPSSGHHQPGRPVHERVQFTWTRSQRQQRSACDRQSAQVAGAGAGGRHGAGAAMMVAVAAGGKLEAANTNFDCAQLTVGRLELMDEGQYKCEITFSESLDFDKCPTTTLSQLNVIAQPNEPELLINGRPPPPPANSGQQPQQQQSAITFKEGAQVRLDCLSSGGRPAPRIEWLNVSLSKQQDDTSGSSSSSMSPEQQQPPEVQLMRSHWPQKKSTYVDSAGAGGSGGHNQQQQTSLPVTSSSVTISLTRYDLNSHFVCLVLPHNSNGLPSSTVNLEQLIKSPVYLASLLASGASSTADKQQQQQQRRPISGAAAAAAAAATVPMFKWIKLDVSVKPTSVGLVVRDLEADEPLEPIRAHRSQQQQPLIATGLLENYLAPFYSLKPNKLYAVQCIVENSRPQSQVAWFNRTAPIAIEARQLNGSQDFIQPPAGDGGSPRRPHRLSSFIRSIGHPDGTFRSIATLLLTTNVWDNFEELFCRISNEAFQFDELLQVAPIISARLYVNYAPFAKLEAVPSSAMESWADDQSPADEDTKGGDSIGTTTGNGRSQPAVLGRPSGGELTLRCSVAANPLSQNTILQIEWLKDGRKLVGASAAAATGKTQQQQQQHSARVHIEKANHLHMPTAGGPNQLQLNQLNDLTSNHQNGNNNNNNIKNLDIGLGNQLVAGSKLIGSSSLTINALARTDSGLYSCHYKLIPAPSVQLNGGTSLANSSQQQIRITSGQANQTIQVNVIDAKPRAPTLSISSSKALLIYGPLKQQQSLPPNGPAGKSRASASGGGGSPGSQLEHLTVTGQPGATISLRCHLPPTTGHQQQLIPPGELSHKIMWHLNGVPIHSSGPQETAEGYYNFTLALPAPGSEQHRVGLFSCSHHVLVSGSSPDNFHGSQVRVLQSANQIELRLRVGPKLVVPAGLKRSELMPPLRSFSELELNANSGNKLRLVCMAQCEPICSIDWHLNGRQLVGGPRKSSKWMQLQLQDQLQQQQLMLANATQQAAHPLWLTRTLEMEPDEELEGAGLVQAENLIHGSSGGWLRAASLATGGRATDSLIESRLLRQETVEIQQQQQVANVFSKLELTYGQLARLLSRTDDNNKRVIIKCKLNPMLNGQRVAQPTGDSGSEEPPAMGHALVDPMRWFPADVSAGSVMDFMESPSAAQMFPFSVSQEPLNLTVDQTDPIDPIDSTAQTTNSVEEDPTLRPSNWSPNSINIDSKPTMDLHARKLLSSGQQPRPTNDVWEASATSGGHPDEMQISILLDRPPRGVSVLFAGISSSNLEPSGGVRIIEGQLIELMDPNKPAPLLECQLVDTATYPRPQFKWTFTDSNGSNHALPGDGPQFDLRKFIEFRQHQLQVDPMSAYGAEVVASFVGNYTCTASNIHGSKSATLPIQIQGRPLCKLKLGNEYLGQDHELLANLRCLVYSSPSLLETIWFRGSQQLAINKSSLADATDKQAPIIKMVQLPIVVLNRQQDFMLMDHHLTNQLANFKCIARNSLGYSEACELSQADKLTLMNTFKPIQGGLNVKPSPAHSLFSIKPLTNGNFLTNNTNSETTTNPNESQQPVGVRLERNFWSFIMIVCLLAATILLLIILIRCLVKRCCSNVHDSRKLHISKPSKNRENTSWRFNPTNRLNIPPGHHHQSNNESITGRLPFQSKTICVNYYGGSNGDSEHDMMQSCNSQSSHYEEFAAVAAATTNHHQMQQPPVYFNNAAATTLTRRTLLKPSLSTSSTGDSGGTSSSGTSGSRPSGAQAGNGNRFGDKSYGTSSRYGPTTNHPPDANGLTLTSNVPLISGSNMNSSRINLNHHHQQQVSTTTALGGSSSSSSSGQQQPHYGRFQRHQDHHQQTFGQRSGGEPIYDDVIYNQMIL